MSSTEAHDDLDTRTDEAETNEEDDHFDIELVPRSESSFVLKSCIKSDPNTPETEQQPPFPIFLKRANTVTLAEFRKRKLRFFNRRKKQSPQIVMADSSSQIALFHHLRGNTLIKQVCVLFNRIKIIRFFSRMKRK